MMKNENHKNAVSGPQLKDTGMNKKRFFINIFSYVLFIGLALPLTVFQNSVFLYKLQDLSLFLPTKMFFLENIGSPGGFLSYSGKFLTQFFYYPWLGSLLFVLFLLAVQLLTVKAFGLGKKQLPYSFIPPLLLLLAVTQLGYEIFTLKSSGYVYSQMIGIMVVLAFFWVYRTMAETRARIFFPLLFVTVAFPIAGFYAFLTLVLFVLYEMLSYINDKNKGRFLSMLASLTVMIAIPFLYYRFFYVNTGFPGLYFEALPKFEIRSELNLWIPFFGLVVFFVWALLEMHNMIQFRISKKAYVYVPVAMFLLMSSGVYALSYNDGNFRTELAMDKAIFDNDWEKVLKLSKDHKGEPTRLIVMNTYLALQKMGLAGDKMFHVKTGDKAFNWKSPVYMMDVAGKMMYYQYGQINYSCRWCMQDMVKHGLKVENLKYFVKTSLLNGEFSLAKKYNDILLKTMFHREWAEKYKDYIDNPEKVSLDPEFKEIIPLMANKNGSFFDKKAMLEPFLMSRFVDLERGSFKTLNISMQFNLELKDLEKFWKYYLFYISSYPDVPVHYQEAALFYAYMKKDIDIGKLKIDNSVIHKFKDLIKMLDQYSKNPGERSRSYIEKRFGTTFWYYYMFDQRIKVDFITN